jgi:hypothetical protein
VRIALFFRFKNPKLFNQTADVKTCAHRYAHPFIFNSAGAIRDGRIAPIFLIFGIWCRVGIPPVQHTVDMFQITDKIFENVINRQDLHIYELIFSARYGNDLHQFDVIWHLFDNFCKIC